nr:DUF4251 domain-containing protein [uncultured Flavobacterium sp.]
MKRTCNLRLVSFLILLLTFFIQTTLFGQEKTRKQLKEERKIEKQKQISILVESKEFVFAADRMNPQGGRTVNLTTDYSVEFHPDLINSYLPFIGRGFTGIGYGGDEGMTFQGKPTIFTIEKTKKAYQIKAEVTGKNDTYSMMLTVSFEGNAYLTINSNNRSSISYDGEIEAFKSKKK